MKSLRFRLIISHTLPLLIILLVTGIGLDYVVETRILLPGLADELTNEAKLVAEVMATQLDLWDNPAAAQAYLDRISPTEEPFITLLDSQGRVIASTDPLLARRPGTPIDLDGQFGAFPAGEALVGTGYSQDLDADVVRVVVPAAVEGQKTGFVQMTYNLENEYARFVSLRYIITGILAVGVLLGAGIAILLSLNLSNAFRAVILFVQQLAAGKEVEMPTETGPEEIRDLTRAVKTLAEELRSMEATRRKLLANLVHELGRPLGALLPAIHALQAGVGEDKELQTELLAGMAEEIGVLRRLLDDLTGLHNQVTGVLELKMQPVDLAELLSNILRTQQEAAQAKGLLWREVIPERLPLIAADPVRLTQAIGNVVNNAIKFTSRGGAVAVEAGQQDGEVWIRVQDNGLGIPVDEQPKVFTPFYRGRSDNRFPQGMGLGLSIARDLIKAHQGRLDFSSVPGEGSSFTIWLPAQPAES